MSGPVVVFALFPRMTQLDFAGPHQVLSLLPGARLVAASAGGRDVEADGLVFARLADIAAVERCDVLCVPGGPGTSDALLDGDFVAQVRRLGLGARHVTSVCTGSLVLGAAGLLRGRRAACHWAWRDLLRPFGAEPDPGRVVRDGNVLTGGGVTAGIDFALTLMAEIAGADRARAVQLALEYAPAPPFDCGRPESASLLLVAAVRSAMADLAAPRRAAVEAAAARLAAAG